MIFLFTIPALGKNLQTLGWMNSFVEEIIHQECKYLTLTTTTVNGTNVDGCKLCIKLFQDMDSP
jgi:hypothetical protein